MSKWIPDPRGYANARLVDVPWGYWLRKDPGAKGLVDENGEVWESLRHYLWHDRLSMGSVLNLDLASEQLLAVLHAASNRRVAREEAVHEFFFEVWRESWHYQAWLEAQDLTERDEVTLEGRAILRMLAATRRRDVADLAPLDFPTLHPWNGLDHGTTRAEREQVMAELEAAGRALRYRFVREPIAGRPAIKLIGYEIGNNIPLTRVLWTLTFVDDYARDRQFAWIAHRLDRWQSWGELAAEHGARALSEHLLLLKFADEPIDGV